MSFKLRDYQQTCYTSILEDLEQYNSTLAVMATGVGKTVIFGSIARDWPMGRVLIVVHRDELMRQAVDKVCQITGEPCAIEMGEDRSDEEGSYHSRDRIVVTSVQTMCRPNRHKRFNPNDFGLIIWDEAHHCVANSYLKVLSYFKSNPHIKNLGVTATPDRADEEALGKVFESVAFEYGVRRAIDDGWLVPIEQQLVWIDTLDFSLCRTTAGDLNTGDLAKIMETEKALHGIVGPTLDIAGDRKVLAFTASVAQADRCSEIANRHRPGYSEFVHGETDKEVRRDLVKRYGRNEFGYLHNCGIALEGFDDPGIQVVSMARPTKSRSLYAQAIGRGTRPLPGTVDHLRTAYERKAAIAASAKPNLLVLDFVGNSGRHKLIHAHDVLGGDYNDDELAEALAEIEADSKRGLASNVEHAFETAAEKRASRKRQEEEEERRKAEVEKIKQLREENARRRAPIKAVATFKSKHIDAFNVFDVAPQREPGWHKGRKPSEKMIAMLRRAGIGEVDLDQMTFCEAGQIISEMNRRREAKLCTFKQAKLLAKYGYDTNTSFTGASAIIDKLAANGWQRPYDVATTVVRPTLPAPVLNPSQGNAGPAVAGRTTTQLITDTRMIDRDEFYEDSAPF